MLSKSDISQKTTAIKQKIKDDHERFMFHKCKAALKDANTYQNLSVLTRLLEQNKLNIYTLTLYGRNLLMMACELGYPETVRLLVKQQKMNPNYIDPRGHTPLSMAQAMNQDDVVEMLYNLGAIDLGVIEAEARKKEYQRMVRREKLKTQYRTLEKTKAGVETSKGGVETPKLDEDDRIFHFDHEMLEFEEDSSSKSSKKRF